MWCPKYRRGVLGGRVAARSGELLEQIADEYGWEIVAKEVMPDHVHLFVRAGPTDALGSGGASVQGPHRAGATRGVSVSAPAREGFMVAVVFCRIGRLRLGIDGAPLHRASVGCGGVMRRDYVFRLRPTARQHIALAAFRMGIGSCTTLRCRNVGVPGRTAKLG